MSRPRAHALVVGIDRYADSPIGREFDFEGLDGGVRDARKFHAYLERDLGLPPEDLCLLTASRGLTAEPREAPADRPGYAQIVGAWRRMATRAEPGDIVLFYFSGHGVRVPSLLPERRPGLDECLVPYDAAAAEGRLLHDLELAYLLAELAAREIDTVVILDACFAGGALRAEPRVRVRGAHCLRRACDELPSAVADLATLRAFAARRAAGWGDAACHPWLAGSRHTLLAACAAHELALEAPLEDGSVGGLFTASLLSALRRAGPGGATYRELLRRTQSALLLAGSRQTPQAEGVLDRVFLGREPVAAPRGVAVLETREDGGLRLAAGALQGLAPGALFRFPLGAFATTVFEAQSVDDHSSVVHAVGDGPPVRIEPGELLGLLSPAPWRLLRRARLVGAAAELTELAVLLTAPSPERESFLRAAAADEVADLRIEVGADGRFAVTTTLGEILALGPPLDSNAPNAASELVRRLAHWARFEGVRTLRNRDSASQLRDAVTLAIDRRIVTEPGHFPAGRSFTLAAANHSDRVLYVTLLSLGADWSIEQLWPLGPWSSLGPGESTPVLLAVGELPAGAERGRAVLKVIASERPASFEWLELPALTAPAAPPVPPTVFRSPLDEFLAAWLRGRVSATNVIRSTAADWATVEWELELHRSPDPTSNG
ncbi:MAG: caspase family protein [Thermoanaerobaculia bacterium]|nr:caspase family protein [Thermoanaerobaculia bacterium]